VKRKGEDKEEMKGEKRKEGRK
jgi:hypothetical protein